MSGRQNDLIPRPWYRFWPEAALLILSVLVIAGVGVALTRDASTVIAIRDIAKGAEIVADDLGRAPLPHIEGVITNRRDVLGGVALEAIAAGSPFSERAVARPQAFAAATIRSGFFVTADSVVFKVTPYIEGAVTSPASLRRLATAEIPAGSAVRLSMLTDPMHDAEAAGDVKRDLAPGQTVVPNVDVVWKTKAVCSATTRAVTTTFLYAGDQLRGGDFACVAPDNVVASYRVFAGPLRPGRGTSVILLAPPKEAGKEPVRETATLLSIAAAGDAATIVVALPTDAAERLAAVSDRLQLLARPGG